MKFKKMWEALKEKNLAKASAEMIDSNWHKQTTKRCESLASVMKNANKQDYIMLTKKQKKLPPALQKAIMNKKKKKKKARK